MRISELIIGQYYDIRINDKQREGLYCGYVKIKSGIRHIFRVGHIFDPHCLAIKEQDIDDCVINSINYEKTG